MADLGPKHGGEADDYYQSAPQQPQRYPNPPPNYNQPYAPPQPAYNAEGKTFEQTFVLDKPKWNDLWAAILFLAVLLGFVAVSGISLQGYAAFKGFNGDGIYGNRNAFGLNTNTLVLFVFVIVVAMVLSWGYILLARAFTKQFIWITGIVQIIMGFVTAIYMLVRGYYSGGIVFLIFAVLSVLFFISWIKRIPFSVVMLQTSVDVSRSYGHVYLVSLCGGLLACALGVWYSITLVAIYAKYEPGDPAAGANPACSQGNGGCSTGKVIGLIVFTTFAMYWVSEVLKNTLHTTVSGVYGGWYFSPRGTPSGATRGALRRSLTYSFGSICFGSLIVAVLNFLRQACSIAQQQAAGEGNMIAGCVFCMLECFVRLLDWLVEFVNRYAFAHIALYGKAYLPAARDTWRLIRDRGIDALVNNCLVGPVMTVGAMAIGFATALLAYLYLVFTDPAYNADGDFTPVVVAFAFVVGLQVANVFTTPLSSGIDTVFVAMAWDPEVLRREHPELWQKMVEVYPRVMHGMMG